jgi:hypothetical protein
MDKVVAVMRRGFLIKLISVIVLVALGDWLFWQERMGIGNLGFYGLAILAALVVSRPATLKSWVGLLATAATTLYCLAIILDIGFFSTVLFVTALSISALAPYATKLTDGWQWFWRLVLHGVMSAFNPFIDAVGLRKVAGRRGPRKAGIRAAVSLLALPIIGGAIFLALFVQANPVLEKIVAQWKLPPFDEVLLFRMILWTIVAGLLWSVLRPWRNKGKKGAVAPIEAISTPALFTISLASIQLSLIVFNAIFAMQNGMDLAFMSEVVPLPEDMTLAQYAHRGAYPLVATAILAGLFVLVMLQPTSAAAKDNLARLLVIVWIIQNVILVASSMIRTWDYVEAYSLTQFRIAALAWMVLVAFGLALICWRMLAGKSGGWLINTNLLTTGIMLTVFCFVDSAGMAARWNAMHAREVGGRGVQLDLCYMSDLGAEAILPLISLEAKPLPEGFRIKVKAVRVRQQQEAQSWMDRGGWTYRLETILTAARAKEATLPPLDLGSDYRDCNGNIFKLAFEASPPSPSDLTDEMTR